MKSNKDSVVLCFIPLVWIYFPDHFLIGDLDGGWKKAWVMWEMKTWRTQSKCGAPCLGLGLPPAGLSPLPVVWGQEG